MFENASLADMILSGLFFGIGREIAPILTFALIVGGLFGVLMALYYVEAGMKAVAKWAKVKLPGLRPPDFQVFCQHADGLPVLNRWHLLRPKERGQAPGKHGGWYLYLHNVLRSDDPILHDHPWWNVTIMFWGSYLDVHPVAPGSLQLRKDLIRAPAIRFRPAEALHRLEVPEGGKGAWTLFLTGPKSRTWGFQCPKGWVPYTDYVHPDATGLRGQGCGETA